jgi:hypothetical protein
VSKWKDQAALESKLRQHAEEEISQLKEQLQLETQNNKIIVEYFRNSFLKYTHSLNKILPLLEESKIEMPSSESQAIE